MINVSQTIDVSLYLKENIYKRENKIEKIIYVGNQKQKRPIREDIMDNSSTYRSGKPKIHILNAYIYILRQAFLLLHQVGYIPERMAW